MYAGPLVGRTRELSAVEGAVAGLRSHQGSVTLLSGEAGIGKTTLLREAARRAQDAELPIAWGVAWDGGDAPAYWPMIQALRALGRTTRGGTAAALEAAAAGLRGTTKSDEQSGDPTFALFDAVATAMMDYVSERPCVMLLDDLHAADHATLRLILYLVRATRSMPVAWIGAYREVEAQLDPAIGRLIVDIGREGACNSLAGLGPEEIAQLVAARTGTDARDLEALSRRTGGNPLFVLELSALSASDRNADELPVTVRRVIADRVRALSDDARGCLEAAAILGMEFSLVALAGVLGSEVEAVAARLEAAVKLGFVLDDQSLVYRFAHPLFREALVTGLDSGRRTQLHLGAATTLERLRDTGMAIGSSEIAQHLLASRSAEHAPKAVEWARASAHDEVRVGAYDRAVRLLSDALRALDQFEASPSLRLDVLLELSPACAHAGDTPRSQELAEQAAELARGLDDAERLARAGLAYGARFGLGNVDPKLANLLEEALEALPPQPTALRAQVLARLGAAIIPTDDAEAIRRAESLAFEATDMIRDTGDRATRLIVALAATSALAADYTHAFKLIEFQRDALALADELGDRLTAIQLIGRLISDLPSAGQLREAELLLSEYQRRIEGIPLAELQGRCLAFQAMLAGMRGRFDEAGTRIEQASALVEQHDDAALRRSVTFLRLGLTRLVGPPEAFESALEAVATAGGVFADSTMLAIVRSMGAIALDRIHEVRGLVTEFETESPVFQYSLSAAFAAEALSYAGDAERARVALSLVDAMPLPFFTWGRIGLWWEGPIERPRAYLHHALGDRAGALDLLETAIAKADALGIPPTAMTLRFDRARIADDGGRAAEVRELAKEAEAAGMHLFAARCTRLADHLEAEGTRPSTPASSPVVPFSLTEEGQLVHVDHQGKSFSLKKSRGLEMLGKLIAAPDREIHALDLSAAKSAEEGAVVDTGDAGPMLDAEAKAAYRRRLQEIAMERREAERDDDIEAQQKLDREVTMLEQELRRATGLGGRDRHVGKAAERARVNVQRRLRDAVARIREQDEALGTHLERALRTGTYCVYRSDPP